MYSLQQSKISPFKEAFYCYKKLEKRAKNIGHQAATLFML